MRPNEFQVRVEPQGEGVPNVIPFRSDGAHEPSLGELFKSLTSDSRMLLQKEVELAKAELRETGTRVAGDVAKVGVAAGLAFVGALALTAFLVIGLGTALGGRYWLSSLLVGVVAAGVGYSMVQSAISDLTQRGITPRQTLETLREDTEWVAQQARELKHGLNSDPIQSSTSSSRL